MAADPVRKTYWVYTNQSLFELVTGKEDRDVWKIFLDQGKHDVALKFAKVTFRACNFHSLTLKAAARRRRAKETKYSLSKQKPYSMGKDTLRLPNAMRSARLRLKRLLLVFSMLEGVTHCVIISFHA
jgi:hypothetical protein